jgi:hypothetical protein
MLFPFFYLERYWPSLSFVMDCFVCYRTKCTTTALGLGPDPQVQSENGPCKEWKPVRIHGFECRLFSKRLNQNATRRSHPRMPAIDRVVHELDQTAQLEPPAAIREIKETPPSGRKSGVVFLRRSSESTKSNTFVCGVYLSWTRCDAETQTGQT